MVIDLLYYCFGLLNHKCRKNVGVSDLNYFVIHLELNVATYFCKINK